MPLPAGVTVKEGGPADAEVMAATLREGFATYRTFAPSDWVPPEFSDAEPMRARLGDPDAWCLLAADDGRPAGHVTLTEARAGAIRGIDGSEPIPGVALLWQLFVREPWWGTGLAAALHDTFTDEAAGRGYAAAKLFVVAGQARARAFYERRGWTPVGEAVLEPHLGLDVVEYRLTALPG